ncbi:MAG: alanyl-tRNA editing protein [Lachnospiraceae bacterium]|nr:alanyl-tRNA editing protein [Lachnospiraceae bacterium]
MEKIFYEDTHILNFEASVLECIPFENIYRVVLDRTAFFPEEGGQLADTGTLNGLPVLDVRIEKDIIYHHMNTALKVGTKVTGHVDWDRRFDFMQQHSGEHIISGLLHKHYGFTNVGFHLGLTEVTLDFDGSIGMDALRDIETEANQIVFANRPIHCFFPENDELETMEYRSKIEIEGAVRIVEIPGVDVCACCAPHVESTAEIGIIKITGVQSHRGGVRINILCGARALTDYTTKQDSVNALSTLLSAKPELVVDAVKKLQEDGLKQKDMMNHLANQLLQLQIASLPAPQICSNPILFVELSNPIAIRNSVNELTGKYSGYCGIFNGNDQNGYSFIIGSSTLDCRTLATTMREQFGAKGGGTAPMIQGNVKARKEDLIALFNT